MLQGLSSGVFDTSWFWFRQRFRDRGFWGSTVVAMGFFVEDSCFENIPARVQGV